MSLQTQIANLITRIGTEFKSIRTVTGSLTALTTTEKTSLVGAINEVKAASLNAGAQINDTTPGAGTVYSSSKTESYIAAQIAALVASAPGLLDTLDELAAALGDDPNFAATTATALNNRVRFDAAQVLTGPQQAQARTNIGAGTSSLVLGTTGSTAKAGDYQPTAANISDSTTVGRSLITALDASTARGAIGAGTSSLTLGTTSSTAKAGDYAPPSATTGALGLIQLAGMLGGTAASPTVRASSTTQTGVVELATTAETTTGTDATLAVTPAGVKAVADTKVDSTAVGNTEADLVALFNTAIA